MERTSSEKFHKGKPVRSGQEASRKFHAVACLRVAEGGGPGGKKKEPEKKLTAEWVATKSIYAGGQRGSRERASELKAHAPGNHIGRAFGATEGVTSHRGAGV